MSWLVWGIVLRKNPANPTRLVVDLILLVRKTKMIRDLFHQTHLTQYALRNTQRVTGMSPLCRKQGGLERIARWDGSSKVGSKHDGKVEPGCTKSTSSLISTSGRIMDFKFKPWPEWKKHMQRHAKTKEKHGCNDVPTLMQIHVTNTIKQCGKVSSHRATISMIIYSFRIVNHLCLLLILEYGWFVSSWCLDTTSQKLLGTPNKHPKIGHR